MKIIRNTPSTLFQEVEVGDVFQYADMVFMRTDDNTTELGIMNAVNFERGITVHFDHDIKVTPLPKAHVVIE